jgi:hypothetical protein
MASKKEQAQAARRVADLLRIISAKGGGVKRPTKSIPRESELVWRDIVAILRLSAPDQRSIAQAEAIFVDHIDEIKRHGRRVAAEERLSERSSNLPRPKTAHFRVKDFLVEKIIASEPKISLKGLKAQLIESALARRTDWLIDGNADRIIYIDERGARHEMKLTVINDSWLSRNRPKHR